MPMPLVILHFFLSIAVYVVGFILIKDNYSGVWQFVLWAILGLPVSFTAVGFVIRVPWAIIVHMTRPPFLR